MSALYGGYKLIIIFLFNVRYFGDIKNEKLTKEKGAHWSREVETKFQITKRQLFTHRFVCEAERKKKEKQIINVTFIYSYILLKYYWFTIIDKSTAYYWKFIIIFVVVVVFAFPFFWYSTMPIIRLGGVYEMNRNYILIYV